MMHMGKRNSEFSYEMGGMVLKVSEEERDLGVIMHKSAKPSRQCAEASKKANSTLGMIRRTIVTRDKDTILRLYKSLVRPQFSAGPSILRALCRVNCTGPMTQVKLFFVANHYIYIYIYIYIHMCAK